MESKHKVISETNQNQAFPKIYAEVAPPAHEDPQGNPILSPNDRKLIGSEEETEWNYGEAVPMDESSEIYLTNNSTEKFDFPRFKNNLKQVWERFSADHQIMKEHWRKIRRNPNGPVCSVEIHDLNLDAVGSDFRNVASAFKYTNRIHFWGSWANRLPNEHQKTLIAHELAHVLLNARDNSRLYKNVVDPALEEKEGEEEVHQLLNQMGFDEDAYWEWCNSAPKLETKLRADYAPGLLTMLIPDNIIDFFERFGVIDNCLFTRATHYVLGPLIQYFEEAFELDLNIQKLASETMSFLMEKLATEYGCKLDRKYDSGDSVQSEIDERFSEDMLGTIFLRDYLMIEQMLFPNPSENWMIGVTSE